MPPEVLSKSIKNNLIRLLKRQKVMTVLLSIKPEFAYKIFDGTKKFEFRRTVFKRKDVRKVVVYASFPVQMVIGEFEIDDILTDKVETIWNKTKRYSGISKDYFNTYFENREYANAIQIGKIRRYKSPKSLSDYNLIAAPQSFMYIG